MGVFFEFDEVDTFTAGADRRAGLAHVLPARPGRPAAGHREVREATGDGHRPVPARGCCRDLPPPEDRPLPAFELRDPGEQSFVLGPIGLGYDRGNDRLLVQLEELVPSPVDDEDDDEVDADDDRRRPRAHPRCT